MPSHAGPPGWVAGMSRPAGQPGECHRAGGQVGDPFPAWDNPARRQAPGRTARLDWADALRTRAARCSKHPGETAAHQPNRARSLGAPRSRSLPRQGALPSYVEVRRMTIPRQGSPSTTSWPASDGGAPVAGRAGETTQAAETRWTRCVTSRRGHGDRGTLVGDARREAAHQHARSAGPGLRILDPPGARS